jgi:TPR repeat protein
MSTSLRLLLVCSLNIVSVMADVATPATKSPPLPDSPIVAEDPDDGKEDSTESAAAAAPRPDPTANKFWQALKLLESKTSAEQATGRKMLQEASDLEYTHAQALLGNCHLAGSHGFPKDVRKAANLFRLAAERGNAYAMVSLGSCLATGTGARRDDAKASVWLTAALAPTADYTRPAPPDGFMRDSDRPGGQVAGELAVDPIHNTQASAHFLLAQIDARQGKALEAQAHYVAAANAGADGQSGIYQAAVEAALNYALGRGIPRDKEKARAMLDQSRRLNARMGVNLIHNYVSLKIVDDFAVADLEESVTEAQAGQQSALQFQIAQSLADKKSKDYNAAEAAQWYELAAENGQVWAMLQLAFMHARGDLGVADPVKAFQWFERAGRGDKPKHYVGVANLAICYQNGLGTARDTEKAQFLFRKHRNADIVCYLGTIGQCPASVVALEEEVSLNQTWAKQKNDAHAQYLLGLRLLGGWGLKPDFNEAVRWFKKSAHANHGGSLNQLGYLYEFNGYAMGESSPAKARKLIIDYYRKGSDAGDLDAMANYANMLVQGDGVFHDTTKAESIYLQCLKIDPEHARSHNNLAAIYADRLRQVINSVDSDSIETNRSLMLKHYEESNRLKFAYAAANLGELYYTGVLVPKDLASAYRHFEDAAEWGLPAAHYSLGFMHEHGEGVPVTYTEAAYHYRLAALEGHIPSLRRLVNFYLTGTGVSLDFDRAAYWLGYMVRLNQFDALPSIADVLLKKGEYEQAVKLLKQLVDLPNPTIAGYAHERLSLCYRAGEGVKKNPKRAEQHLKLAIEMGNGTALATLAHRHMAAGRVAEAIDTFTRAAKTSNQAAFNLGQIYYFGTNVPVDRALAMKYLRQAARDNNRDAQFFLAGTTFNNETDAPTLDEAIALALKAEGLGHPKAADLREKLERRRKVDLSRPEENSRSRSS